MGGEDRCEGRRERMPVLCGEEAVQGFTDPRKKDESRFPQIITPFLPLRHAMAIVSLKCPNCAGSVELDDSREFGFCQYCGNKIMIQQEINNIIVQSGSDTQAARIAKLINEHIMFGRINDAKKLLDDLSKLDGTHPELPLLTLKTIVATDFIAHKHVRLKTMSESKHYLDDYRTYSGRTVSFPEMLAGMGIPPPSKPAFL